MDNFWDMSDEQIAEGNFRVCSLCGINIDDKPKWHKECSSCYRKCNVCFVPLGNVPSYFKQCRGCYGKKPAGEKCDKCEEGYITDDKPCAFCKKNNASCTDCGITITSWKTRCMPCFVKNKKA
ncbi:Hypothetical protein BRZCDTV_79 [Brazilian cedratvirus IHUMI]|uniref:Uncharacterized protein n=1 Tax=Brazilian cedratvirus IHUMI TaxID=2126980 RepID=A0A2R8FDI7_9VIRU|nr:Hypothetical protein BRZCDTV_79 [Brazilian cedratvirus IHUMI]